MLIAMRNGKPDHVPLRKCIDEAAKGGDFILSTGDQWGRDTPDKSIRKLVEVCESYGRSESTARHRAATRRRRRG